MHAGVRILEVGGGVALEAEHLVVGEDVVALAVLAEVEVLHRADPHRCGDVVDVGRYRLATLDSPLHDELP